MALETYNDLKDYLQQLASEHKGIKDFSSGNFDRLKHFFGGKRPKTPVLFVEWPSLNLADYDDQTEGLFTFGVFLLKVVGADKFDDQDDAINECTELARDMMARMVKDQQENGSIFRIDFTIEPVTFLMIDNCFGAKFEISLGDHTGLVYDSTKWR